VTLHAAWAVRCRVTLWDGRLSDAAAALPNGVGVAEAGPVPEFRTRETETGVSRVMHLDRAPSACVKEQDS
jgi:hypothetical protein